MNSSKINNFKALGRYICKENMVSKVLVSLGRPSGQDEIFLKYDNLENDFSIVWADGVKMSDKIFRKLLPDALLLFLTAYKSKNKKHTDLRVKEEIK